jgi:hypothetical protein
VVSATVALDGEPSIDDEVDAADAAHNDLRLDLATKPSEHQAQEAFRTRFAATIHERHQHGVTPWETAEYLGQVAEENQAHVQCAVEGGDGGARRLAEHAMCQSIEYRYDS